MKVGLALKPKTPVDDKIKKLVQDGMVDMILVMTVEPGFSGQKFMHDVMPKLSALRKEFPYLDLQVDGGVNEETIDIVAENGANCIVSGSCVFDSKDPHSTISKMSETVKKHLATHNTLV
jgi:ribulose-phosphate 3-epimerase